MIRALVVGQVDHGKSTLVGRLLGATGSLSEATIAAARGADGEVDWSRFTDAIAIERETQATVDVGRAVLRGEPEVALLDAPGHEEFLRNVISGAAVADRAIFVVSADSDPQARTRTHARILRILAVTEVFLVVTKADRVPADRVVEVLEEERVRLLESGLNLRGDIALDLRSGEGKAEELAPLIRFLRSSPRTYNVHFRGIIRDVLLQDGSRRAVVSVRGGSIGAGESLLVSPGRVCATIEAFHGWPEAPEEVADGDDAVVSFTESVFLKRGMVLSRVGENPTLTRRVHVELVAPEIAVEAGDEFHLEMGGQGAMAKALSVSSQGDMFYSVELSLERDLAIDLAPGWPLSTFACVRRGEVFGVGRFMRASDAADPYVSWEAQGVDRSARERALGQSGLCIWMTGLSASGKSTLARRVDQELTRRGRHTYVLDGDMIRHGICRDLGFELEDRRENIRRVGEIARLFVDAGLIVIAAFISPERSMRESVASLLPEGRMMEVWVDAPIEICEARDPKGLYRMARAGELENFTGVDSPYEEPLEPALRVDTASGDIAEAVELIVRMVETRQ